MLLRFFMRLWRRGRSGEARAELVVVQHEPRGAAEAVPSCEILAEVVLAPVLPSQLIGPCMVIDGDTIRIAGHSIRLAGMDAPELDHPWGQQAKWHLVRLCKGQSIRAEISPRLSYDRLVATCFLPDGRDLGAEMVRAGLALDWPRFSQGRYAHLEPPGIRRKHWRAAARQRGDMATFAIPWDPKQASHDTPIVEGADTPVPEPAAAPQTARQQLRLVHSRPRHWGGKF